MAYLELTKTPPRPADDRVLVVDDDPDIREILQSLLTEAGYRVVVAADGREAMALGREFVATMALLDVAMPNANGLETCEALRRLPGWGEVPIVMLTGLASNTIAKAAARAGATGFMVKPFNPLLLLQNVEAWVAQSQGIRAQTLRQRH